MLDGADLAWADGGGLGPEGVTDQEVEFRSRFRRFRPRDSERAADNTGFVGVSMFVMEREMIPFVKVQDLFLKT